jgi:hypothetical protein
MFWACDGEVGGRRLACESLKLMFITSLHCCCQLNPMVPEIDRFHAASNIWPCLRLVGILNQTLSTFIQGLLEKNSTLRRGGGGTGIPGALET